MGVLFKPTPNDIERRADSGAYPQKMVVSSDQRRRMNFEIKPKGSFDLSNTNQYFGGWLTLNADDQAIVMTFPVEGWQTSAAVVVRRDDAGRVIGAVHCADQQAQAACQQALATLSRDYDGTGWSAVGERDPLMGRLQVSYKLLRPVLFHSPYEAAAAFVIDHRLSIKQGRAIRQAMAKEYGDKVQVGDDDFYAFPRPEVLRKITTFKSVSPAKIPRLHGIAEAALEGWLDRTTLRAMPEEEALTKIRSLKGIGEFFSQGILYRGAGLADAVPDDEVTKQAFHLAFKLKEVPNHETVLKLADPWRPFRMWATVLLHVWFRREEGGPKRPSSRPRVKRA
jgi:DNA-3-methyladenine glycosylase II